MRVSQNASPTFERVVIERAELLNQRTVLRSALEYVLDEVGSPTLLAVRLPAIRDVCRMALEQTEAGS